MSDFKVAIFTLTKGRLIYSKRAFNSLRARTGMDYDLFVVDNGSEDGSAAYLRELESRGAVKQAVYNSENLGISIGSNQALDLIAASDETYDFIVKFDNDCEIVTDDWLRPLCDIINSYTGRILLSPQILGLKSGMETGMPDRSRSDSVGEYTLIPVKHLGGICLVAPAGAYRGFRFHEGRPLHGSQDIDFSFFGVKHGYRMAYVNEVEAQHIDSSLGQLKRFPKYFEDRDRRESTTVPGESPATTNLKRPFRRAMHIRRLHYLGLLDEGVIAYFIDKIVIRFLRGIRRGAQKWA